MGLRYLDAPHSAWHVRFVLLTHILKNALCTVILVTCAPTAFGALVYDTAVPNSEFSGFRTENSGGLLTGDRYATDTLDFRIAWDITGTAGNWDYKYTLSGFAGGKKPLNSPAISHFVLELSDACKMLATCVTSAGTNGTIDSTEVNTYVPGGMGNSNPGLANTIYGIKFNVSDSGSGLELTFHSTQAPVWGDFYLKGGSDSFVYNVGTTKRGTSMLTSEFIARPDTVSGGAVPEPASFGLVGAAIAALVYARRK